MKETEKLLHKTVFTSALITSGVLLVYFLVMMIIGLAYNIHFRMFNYVITLLGLYFAMGYFKRNLPYTLNYLEGFGFGIYFTAVTGILFGLYFMIYLNLDTVFLRHLGMETNFGPRFTPAMGGFYVFIETFVTGAPFSLIVMMIYKREDKKTELEEMIMHPEKEAERKKTGEREEIQ